MKTTLKFFGFFLAVVLLLSITINDKTIFTHIYAVISPGTKGAQKVTESFVDSAVVTTKKYSKKIFDNSVPKVKSKMKNAKDAVSANLSAPVRLEQEPLDDIKNEEKEELDELIKTQN
jgi:hypothetical protein